MTKFLVDINLKQSTDGLFTGEALLNFNLKKWFKFGYIEDDYSCEEYKEETIKSIADVPQPILDFAEKVTNLLKNEEIEKPPKKRYVILAYRDTIHPIISPNFLLYTSLNLADIHYFGLKASESHEIYTNDLVKEFFPFAERVFYHSTTNINYNNCKTKVVIII